MIHYKFLTINVPAHNAAGNRTDTYVNFITEWNDKDFYSNGEPMFIIKVVDASHRWDFVKVKNWTELFADAERIAMKHFAALVKEIRREELADLANPVLARYEPTY